MAVFHSQQRLGGIENVAVAELAGPESLLDRGGSLGSPAQPIGLQGAGFPVGGDKKRVRLEHLRVQATGRCRLIGRGFVGHRFRVGQGGLIALKQWQRNGEANGNGPSVLVRHLTNSQAEGRVGPGVGLLQREVGPRDERLAPTNGNERRSFHFRQKRVAIRNRHLAGQHPLRRDRGVSRQQQDSRQVAFSFGQQPLEFVGFRPSLRHFCAGSGFFCSGDFPGQDLLAGHADLVGGGFFRFVL